MLTYAACSEQANLPIAFDDLNSGMLDKWGVTENEATRLLHVIHNGKLHVGFDAMLILWKQMPRYRFLAHICRLPGLFQVLDWGYEHVAARIIYERHQRRKAQRLVGS